MAMFSPTRRRGDANDERIPPGQHWERGFPVLSIGPTPNVRERDWEFRVTTESGATRTWSWDGTTWRLRGSPSVS